MATSHNLQVLRGLSTNQCLLSCTSDGSKVDLFNRDDGSGRQQWSFVPVPNTSAYNILIGGGVSTDRKYLSCTSDGTKVDLYNQDDGSGRQRWVLIPVLDSPTCSTFLIRVLEGVSSNLRYLSCTADGAKVDLYSQDDGSGRQRWMVQSVWIA